MSTLPRESHTKRSLVLKHENIERRYPCDQCEYAATHSSHLKRHKASIHEGVRYPCDQCEHVATQVSHLKHHKKVKHKSKITESEFVETFNASEIIAEVKEESAEDPLSLVTIDPLTQMKMDPLSLMTMDPLSQMKMDPVEEEFPEYDPRFVDLPLDVKQETDVCDLESMIEIEDDFIIKTEFLD